MGQYCKGAGCSNCEKDDVCDGFDNDCNGKIDDGPKADRDNDGWSYCGVGKEPDCDDSDPTIHPTAPEVCNGKDDNCNGLIDENVCVDPGAKCSPKLGKCISNPCDPMDPMACMNGMICDPGTLQCVTPAAKKLGDPCMADSECVTGLCAGANVLANRLGPGAVCSKTCCVSDDCPTGFVCFAPGTGGNYCVSANALGRTVGATKAGAPSQNQSDCRSGLLGNNGRCVDSCCSASNCAQGSSCMLGMLDGHRTLMCTTPFGAGGQDSDCNSTSACSAGACASYGNVFTYNACIMPCCGSGSCGNLFGGYPTVCWDMDLGNGEIAPLCGQTKQQGGGSASVGAPCSVNNQCRSDRCYQNKYCTDVCCVDSDCPIDMSCRPTDLGGKALRCVKKS
jgi:hypothetical protein